LNRAGERRLTAESRNKAERRNSSARDDHQWAQERMDEEAQE